MKTSEERKGAVTIIHVSGRLDAQNSPDFETRLKELISRGDKHLVLNLEQMDYISSAGLRVLLSVLKLVDCQGGKVKLVKLQPPVEEIFVLTDFLKIFESFPDLDSCLASFAH